jgi:hypothetical protein
MWRPVVPCCLVSQLAVEQMAQLQGYPTPPSTFISRANKDGAKRGQHALPGYHTQSNYCTRSKHRTHVHTTPYSLNATMQLLYVARSCSCPVKHLHTLNNSTHTTSKVPWAKLHTVLEDKLLQRYLLLKRALCRFSWQPAASASQTPPLRACEPACGCQTAATAACQAATQPTCPSSQCCLEPPQRCCW